MALIIRPTLASDAQSIGNLARQFASYLRELGDLTDFKLTANAYLRDGFGTTPAFAGLVAEDQGKVIGYLLYHFGYDSDRAARNMLHLLAYGLVGELVIATVGAVILLFVLRKFSQFAPVVYQSCAGKQQKI